MKPVPEPKVTAFHGSFFVIFGFGLGLGLGWWFFPFQTLTQKLKPVISSSDTLSPFVPTTLPISQASSFHTLDSKPHIYLVSPVITTITTQSSAQPSPETPKESPADVSHPPVPICNHTRRGACSLRSTHGLTDRWT